MKDADYLKVHVFQHEPHEGPGNIQRWLIESGKEVGVNGRPDNPETDKNPGPGDATRPGASGNGKLRWNLTSTLWFEGQEPPQADDVDLLIVMGGSMNVDDESRHPWLIKEKLFIEKSIKQGKKVLGICLGAQLIACVLGARVYRNKHREVGWFPVFSTSEARKRDLYQSFPEKFTAFHWHGDTFEIPYSGFRTFYNECTANQGFQFGNNVVAIQFHIESSVSQVRDFIRLTPAAELKKERFVQPGREIIRQNANESGDYKLLSSLMEKLATAG